MTGYRQITQRALVAAALLAILVSPTGVCAQDDDDPGVDIGWVITTRANLRSEPYADAPIVRELVERELVVLLSRSHVNGWYHVIHVDSADEGWISGYVIKVRYTSSPRPAPTFTPSYVDSYSNPTVSVTNDSYKTLTLSVAGTRYSIAPHSTRSITVRPGRFDFYATAPGVVPLAGTKVWEVGYEYTWRFWIVTTYR